MHMGSDERREEPVELDNVFVVRESEKALLCNIENEEVWIPKSMLLDGSDVGEDGDTGTLVIPRWLAVEKEIIEEED